MVLGIGHVLSGKLLCYNALTSQTSTLKVKRNDTIIESVLKEKNNFQKKQLNISCETDSINISIKDIISGENIQFIDVRELHEQPRLDHLEVTPIPLSVLEISLDKIDSTKKKVLFCQSGIRSKNAVKLLQELDIDNCFSIIEGASEIKNIINKRHCDEGTTEAISSK